MQEFRFILEVGEIVRTNKLYQYCAHVFYDDFRMTKKIKTQTMHFVIYLVYLFYKNHFDILVMFQYSNQKSHNYS
jgi:hypothetical protein